MARSYDIADLMTSDGEYLTDQVRRKINGNFRRVLQIMRQELPGQERQQIVSAVTSIVDDLFDRKLQEMMAQLMDDAYPVGSVIVTATSSDPRLSHGSWEQVGGGRYVRAAGGGIPVMDEGGSDERMLSMDELPVSKAEILTASGDDAAFQLVAPTNPDQRPVPIEPEYIALLFYRRIA